MIDFITVIERIASIIVCIVIGWILGEFFRYIMKEK